MTDGYVLAFSLAAGLLAATAAVAMATLPSLTRGHGGPARTAAVPTPPPRQLDEAFEGS